MVNPEIWAYIDLDNYTGRPIVYGSDVSMDTTLNKLQQDRTSRDQKLREKYSNESGCELTNKLWEGIAKCNKNKENIMGVKTNRYGYVLCADIKDFLDISMKKCQLEQSKQKQVHDQ
jgi:hypothetical protein